MFGPKLIGYILTLAFGFRCIRYGCAGWSKVKTLKLCLSADYADYANFPAIAGLSKGESFKPCLTRRRGERSENR